jgi:hypothetical protein
MNNEALDRRAEGKYTELMGASEFGFATLLASIQVAIERGCSEFNFKESLLEVPLATVNHKWPQAKVRARRLLMPESLDVQRNPDIRPGTISIAGAETLRVWAPDRPAQLLPQT